MCGIVGYVGNKDAVGLITAGLRRLEYRGYDSAGVAVVRAGSIASVKTEGKLAVLEARLQEVSLSGSTLGVGHTRWATHGVPNQANAHPHYDADMRIAVVHNGIIENYAKIKEQLQKSGTVFRSETDSETLAHLIRAHYSGDLTEAVRCALLEVEGSYAVGVVCADEPGLLVAARRGSPLVVGLGEGESFLASDVPAILRYTRDVIYLDDGQLCTLTKNRCIVFNGSGGEVTPEIHHIEWDEAAAEKQGYSHFMLKEIHEQPEVLANTLRGRVGDNGSVVHLEDMNIAPDALRALERIHITACGTAWHAALIGKYLIEHFARVPVETDVASEYRYRNPIVPPNTLMIAVSQSGETADTLEAMRIAKAHGAHVAAIVNVVGSSAAREADGVIYQHAGPEIGVASTKAYTSQLMALALFALWLAETRGVLTPDQLQAHIEELRRIPEKVRAVIASQEAIQRCAADPKYLHAIGAFFMGRGWNFPTALEGALKLKEISYMHAEGYAAGEMKHGPIALVTDKLPAISIALQGATYEKMISNIQEIRARKGIVLSLANEGDTLAGQFSDDTLYIPACPEPFSPILAVIPLQLFAYYIASNRGCDVDMPRNLAKSVTVE